MIINWIPGERVGEKIRNKLQPLLLLLEYVDENDDIRTVTNAVEDLVEISKLPEVEKIIPCSDTRREINREMNKAYLGLFISAVICVLFGVLIYFITRR